MSMPWKQKEIIGECTLYLGDARHIGEYVGEVGAVISDPPYGMSFRSNYRGVKHEAIANDGNCELLQWACDYPASHSRYIFCRWDNLIDVPKPKSCITWVKNNWSMGDLEHEHARQTEVALFYPGPDHFFPNGRPTDVIEAPRTGNCYHPTEKPVMLMWAIIKWTDGLVFDPFMGSGTTGVACAKLRRHFVGIELDEKYFEISCRRIQEAYTQPDMFVTAPMVVPEQLSILDGSA